MKIDKKEVLKALENITVPGEGQNIIHIESWKRVDKKADKPLKNPKLIRNGKIFDIFS